MSNSPLSPHLLSQLVESAPARKIRLLEMPTSRSCRERIREWFIDKQTTAWGFVVFFVIMSFCLAFCVLAPVAVQSLYLTDLNLDIASHSGDRLATIAEVSAGIAGILLAVIVFSVQLHAQRDDEGAFMTRYLLQKHLVPWITGYALGFASFNALIVLLDGLEVPVWWRAAALIDIVGIVVLFGATYWLIDQSVRDARDSTFDLSFQLFRRELAETIAYDSYIAELKSVFHNELEKTSIQEVNWLIRNAFHRMNASTEHMSERSFHVTLPFGMKIIDIDLTCLHGLNEQLQSLAQRTKRLKAEIALSPGAKIDTHPALILSAEKPNDRQQDGEHTSISPENFALKDIVATQQYLDSALTDDFVDDIQNLLDRTFVVGRLEAKATDALSSYFDRMKARLEQYAKSGESIALRQLLDRYSMILEITAIEHQKLIECSTRTHFFGRGNTNPLHYDLFELVRLGFASRDQGTIDALVRAANNFYHVASTRHSPALCDWALQILGFIYLCGTGKHQHVLDNEYLTEEYDRLLHSIYIPFECRRLNVVNGVTQDQLDQSQSEVHRLDAAISFNLNLIRTACDANRGSDAALFVDRLMEYREHRHLGHDMYSHALTEETVDTLHDYGLMLIVGWAIKELRSLSENDSKREQYQLAIEAAIQFAPSREALVSVWELYHRDGNPSLVDSRLQVEFLDRHATARRVGKVYSGSGGDGWRMRGALALMLCASPHRSYPKETFFVKAPKSSTWNLEYVSRYLKDLITVVELGGDETERDSKAQALLNVIEKRCFDADKSELLKIAETPIYVDQEQTFRKDAIECWQANRRLVAHITRHSDVQTAMVSPLASVCLVQLPLDSLQADNNWGFGFGRFGGEELAKSETIRLLYSTECVRELDTVAMYIRDLRDKIKLAKKELESKGYQPNSLIIPRDHRFLFAIVRQPVWEVKSRVRGLVIGSWEGLEILIWPYIDPSSILILDSARFFGRCQDGIVLPQILIESPNPDSAEEFRSKIETANSLDDLPDHTDLTTNARLQLNPIWGIADPNAAFRIGIENSDGLFALVPDDNEYHRPWCANYSHEQRVLSLGKRLGKESSDRMPCNLCKPDKWDHEAFVGEDTCIGPDVNTSTQ